MTKIDPFTQKRLTKFIQDFRTRTGQLPTLKDLSTSGFDAQLVDLALKQKLIETFYVTLTNGTIVKGYKLKS